MSAWAHDGYEVPWENDPRIQDVQQLLAWAVELWLEMVSPLDPYSTTSNTFLWEAESAYFHLAYPPRPLEVLEPAKPRGEVTQRQRWRIFKRDGYQCQECGSDTDLTVDHIVPQSKGGPHEDENLRTLCRPCNSRKGAR